MTTELIRQIEEMAANAWPAAINQAVDGWRLRYSYGVTQRANSVLPHATGGVALDEKLVLVEEFYARRGTRARYQISPASQPAELDAALEGRGYSKIDLTSVQTATLASIQDKAEIESDYSIRVRPTLEKQWFDTYCLVHGHTGVKADMRRETFQRIGPPHGFAYLRLDGQIVGVGLAVVERGWLGIFSMATLPNAQRRGVASALLGAMAAWGQQQGATQAYLQVHAENEPALKLYEKLGFSTLYQYYYREK
ncbi:MAG: GNAT family N-acetyltransferase [Chloroflexaceae bacterium]|jgi:ribosomal protein S18 acetylase RimI-like enzyme|nr:GNAT family N-acetyltransferase [Chloroflexaceae bacterium]